MIIKHKTSNISEAIHLYKYYVKFDYKIILLIMVVTLILFLLPGCNKTEEKLSKIINGSVYSIDRFDDNRIIVSDDHSYKIVDISKGKTVYKSSKVKAFGGVVYNPIASCFLEYDLDGNAKIVRDGKIVASQNMGEMIEYRSICPCKDGFIYFNEIDGNLYLWTEKALKTLKLDIGLDLSSKIPAERDRIDSITVINDNELLLTVSSDPDEEEIYMDIYRCRIEGTEIQVLSNNRVEANLYLGTPHIFEENCLFGVSLLSDDPNYMIYHDIAFFNYENNCFSLFFGEQNTDNHIFIDSYKISPDGKHIAIIGNKSLYVFSVESKELEIKQELEYPHVVSWFDQNTVLIGTWKGLFKLTV